MFGVREPGQPLKSLSGVAQDVTVYRGAEQARAHAEEQERLNQVLAGRIRELDHSQRVSALTSECVELVQRCVTLDEGIELASRFLVRMYPDVQLSIYIKPDVGHDLLLHSCSGHSGAVRPRQLLDPAECWGLRTRRVYVASPHSTHLTCRHLLRDPNESGPLATTVDPTSQVTVCAPLLSLEKLIGLVSMTLDAPQADDARERIKRTVAQFETTMQSLGGALSTISLRESLQRLALIDELTVLPNRRAFMAALQKSYHRAKRTHDNFTLAILDVDHFKHINDTRGHDEGDRVLKQLAEIAIGFFRTEDSLGRMGGEEFGIMLVGITPTDAFKRLDAFREEVSQRCRVGQESVYVSIGFACSGRDSHSSVDTLMLAADAALYDAKRNGRNRVVVSPLCAALVDDVGP
jgi:diguanylate cyclase (GGDEF)-like protein